jgi:hypothetical protein
MSFYEDEMNLMYLNRDLASLGKDPAPRVLWGVWL